MITIEQLLESVDLDFEPRWVTKDGDGGDEDVVIHKERPTADIESESWDAGFKRKTIGSIKLAEFANKHWTECIYEVPRKTTGKLKHIERIDDSFVDKINAIIDTVNKLMGDKHPTSTPQVPHKQKGANNE